MADLTKLVDAYTDGLLHPAIRALKEILPPEFYVVEHTYFPDWKFSSSVEFVAETKGETEQWMTDHVHAPVKREEGKFPVHGHGSHEQIRVWTKVFETTGKKEGNQPTAGILYRIIKSSPAELALRLVG